MSTEPVPQSVGRYQIVCELGRGAMGLVYRAIDPNIGRTVALKTLRLDALGIESEEVVRRFKNEARAAGLLNHPNIVTIYDAGEIHGMFYIAMEFIEGVTLQSLMNERRMLPVDQIITLSRQICSGLDYAHSHEVIHRDVKPANLMLTPNGTVKIMDFGIAKAGGGMTSTGQVLGTPNYMSPEQVKGRPLDGRSDLFSFGVILYEMVTGEKPFMGQNITTIIYKIVNEAPIPPRELDVTVHPGLNAVIAKSLAKAPDDRYQTGAELMRDLENYKSYGSAGFGASASATTVMSAATLSPASEQTQVLANMGDMGALNIPPIPRASTPQAAAPVPLVVQPASDAPTLDEPDWSAARRAEHHVAQNKAAAAPSGSAAARSKAAKPAAPVKGVQPGKPAGGKVQSSSAGVLDNPVYRWGAIAAVLVIALGGLGLFLRSRHQAQQATSVAQTQPATAAPPVVPPLNMPPASAPPGTASLGTAGPSSVTPPAGAPNSAAGTIPATVPAPIENATSPTAAGAAALKPGADTAVSKKDAAAKLAAKTLAAKNRLEQTKMKGAAVVNTAPSTVAAMNIASTPDGARVMIDGILQPGWKTPFQVPKIAPGPHTVSFSKTGYVDETRSVMVLPGKVASVAVRMSAKMSMLSVSSTPEGAAIFVDGKSTAKVTPAQINVEKGEHNIVLRLTGFKDAAGKASPAEGQTYSFNPKLMKEAPGEGGAGGPNAFSKLGHWLGGGGIPKGKGRVSVRSTPPGALISLNGAATSKKTPAKWPLDPGNYTIVLTLKGYKPAQQNIIVEEGKQVELLQPLEPQ